MSICCFFIKRVDHCVIQQFSLEETSVTPAKRCRLTSAVSVPQCRAGVVVTGSMRSVTGRQGLLKRGAILAVIAILFVALPYGWRPSVVDDRRGSGDQAPIGLMAGRLNGTYLQMADDIARLVEPRDIRVIPMVGRGSVQALDDMLTLESVDIAMLQTDVLNLAKANRPEADLEEHIYYVTALFAEELHVLARRDIASIWDLEGKTVNVGPASTGGFLTSMFVFADLGIEIDVRTMDLQEAFSALERGELAAMTRIVGQPAQPFPSLSPHELHFLSVPADQVGLPYRKAKLTRESYPNLIDQPIETVAVSSVLATSVDPERPGRQVRIDRFVEAFFSGFSRLRGGDLHPKWQEVNPAIAVPGWQRLPSAKQALTGLLRRRDFAYGR